EPRLPRLRWCLSGKSRFRRADAVCELYPMTASCARFLNILGLVISLLAAFLMCYFPLSANPIFREKKTGKWHVVGGLYDTPVVPWWKVWRARLGPILLALGFFLQIIAAAIT